jgi:hypothetical protein
MLSSLEPRQAILPICKTTLNPQSFRGLLGTGFVVGSTSPFVVTAAHVFRDNPLGEKEEYAVFLYHRDGTHKLGLINNPTYCQQADVAVFGVAGVEGVVRLPVLDGAVASNEDVLTFEYSSTVTRALDQGVVGAHFSPFTHKGNILRQYNDDFASMTDVTLLDTSFPALQGASGAPVLRARDFAVTGMLIANRERHLLPAQVVRVTTEDGMTEEIKYFLPTGMALSCTVIRSCLDSLGVGYDTISRDAP